jgi:hypothetical protein
MLFGSTRDFSDVREQSVRVGTVDTANLLDGVEVGQTASIEDEVVSASNLRNSIDGEANCLIDGDGKVQQ